MVAPRSSSVLAPSAVAQLGWARLPDLFAKDELRAALGAMSEVDAPTSGIAGGVSSGRAASPPSSGAGGAEPLVVFPAEALNFYREQSVQAAVVAHVLDGGEQPLGWASAQALESAWGESHCDK